MSLHHLGNTRSRRALDHLLQTPDTFVFAPLPGMAECTAAVHAAPALGAAFTQYTAVFDPGGTLGQAHGSRFVYVLQGILELACGDGPAVTLQAGGYAFLPAGRPHIFRATTSSRAAVIEKDYVSLEGTPLPEKIIGQECDVVSTPLLGDSALQVRTLLPASTAFDFAANTMEYQPGARLSMVEVHVMEHGLLMLEGEGIYRLGDAWYPVAAGDFIWMAPYCPQWFGALGSRPARYLIYKDWNRHPLANSDRSVRG